MFRACVLIVRRSKLYYTASGIITPIGGRPVHNLCTGRPQQKTQQNFIMFIIVLGQHVSILIESSSGPSKKTDPYLKMFKMRCAIPNAG